jgi:acetyl-CoA acyltransferase
VLPKPAKGYPAGHETLHSTTLGWRMVNPAMPEQWTISLGASAEKLAAMYDISRDEQDAFALRSHRLTARAYEEGVLTEVVPVAGVELARDEGIRTDTSVEKLRTLKPAFVAGGTVTAGNSSPLTDGAAILLMGDAEAAERIGRAPLARVVATGVHDLDPEKVNIRGGAMAIGHPLGASGARILGRLAHELHRCRGGYGLAAICIGVGQGLAVVLEG